MVVVDSRNYHLDNVKFFLIFLVILGHALPRLGTTDIGNAIGVSFYFFHMPLMVMISGYFSKKTESKKFWRSFFRLLESFVIFDVLLTLRWALSGDFQLSIISIITPRWTLWYLVSLMFWRAIIQFFPTLHCQHKVVIGIAITIGVLSGFVPVGEPFSFQRTCSYFPYFLVGYYLRKSNTYLSVIKFVPKPVATLFLLSLPVITYFVDFPLGSLLEGKSPYYDFDYSLWAMSIFRMGMYLVCIFASFCVLGLVSKKEIPWVTKQGKDTLLYYLYHTTIIYGFIFVSNHLFHLPGSTIDVFGYTLIVIMVIWILIQVPFFRHFPNIVSYLSEKKS